MGGRCSAPGAAGAVLFLVYPGAIGVCRARGCGTPRCWSFGRLYGMPIGHVCVRTHAVVELELGLAIDGSLALNPTLGPTRPLSTPRLPPSHTLPSAPPTSLYQSLQPSPPHFLINHECNPPPPPTHTHIRSYDAYMTGAVFAALEAVVGQGEAAEAQVSRNTAHADMLPCRIPCTAVCAHQNPKPQPPAPKPPNPPPPRPVIGTHNTTPAVYLATLLCTNPCNPPPPARQEGVPPLPYQTVAPYVWRLNVTRSDLPYALLRPFDPRDPAATTQPVPERPLVFYLGQLCYGVRANDIHRACEEAGVGKVGGFAGCVGCVGYGSGGGEDVWVCVRVRHLHQGACHQEGGGRVVELLQNASQSARSLSCRRTFPHTQ